MTTFDEWLRQLRAAGKLAPNGINIDRSLPFLWTFAIQGNWAGATVLSALHIAPDAEGSSLVDFTCADLGYDADAGQTTFSLALTAVQTAALPADEDGDALVTLPWDVVFTPLGGEPMRLFGGIATIAGRVTNA